MKNSSSANDTLGVQTRGMLRGDIRLQCVHMSPSWFYHSLACSYFFYIPCSYLLPHMLR